MMRRAIKIDVFNVIKDMVKNTLFFFFLFLTLSCNAQKQNSGQSTIIVGANRPELYLSLLQGKKVGLVANHTSVIFKTKNTYTHIVDSLINDIEIKKVFSPEHGFRGKADAGQKISDDVDAKTNIPIISLYHKNRKPSAQQLKGIEVMVYDIQDVGVRFYTYISTLQLVMEACAENKIPLIVLDRPNPNGHYVDGPVLELEHKSFLGMNPIPLVYGMTIGEYALMVNGEGWLDKGIQVDLTVIPLKNYTHNTPVDLAIRPSPNLPNTKAVNLYPSLGLFEGTNVNAGRGTDLQFQQYGASFLDSLAYPYRYVPIPQLGASNPKEKNKRCFGVQLQHYPKLNEVKIKWILEAYSNTKNKSLFFKDHSFTLHSGTKKLQQQIELGLNEKEIKNSWKADLITFKQIRKNYLLYP